MDGIFVAYHNTEQQFGFQYVPVKEMENAIYGSQNPDAGRLIFHRCVEVMEVLLEQIVSRFPAQASQIYSYYELLFECIDRVFIVPFIKAIPRGISTYGQGL